MADLVHKSLECLCSIPEAERHLCKLKQAKWDCDSGLGDIFGGNWNLVVRTHEVQFREDGGAFGWLHGDSQTPGIWEGLRLEGLWSQCGE